MTCMYLIFIHKYSESLGKLNSFTQLYSTLLLLLSFFVLRLKAVELVLEHCKALQPELRREEHRRTGKLRLPYELSMLAL